ncbi:glycoside hydrolase [Mesorhizobium sp. M0142]|uniref:glycoside hydrolase family 25 protein n=1 Tax=unclassified Mesorhizobium TaxID=325217 RepID=UPI00333C8A32
MRIPWTILACLATLIFPLGQIDTVCASDIDAELADLINESSRSDLIAADVAEEGPLSEQDIESFDLRGPFAFPDDAETDRTTGLPRDKSLFCIDVSHHQGGGIDFGSMRKQSIRCVYVKATQGIRYKDPRFAENWSALGNLPDSDKLYRGAYHFLTADDDATTQASNFLRLVQKHGGFKPNDLPPVVDLEWDIGTIGGPDRWRKYKAGQIIDKTLKWLSIVEKETGEVPMIYTARAWWREAIGSEDKFEAFSRYRLWIADYSRSSAAVEVPKVPRNADWDLWQFSDRAAITIGFDRGVDANIFRGTEAEFLSNFGLN